ncbi:MAG: hypothetical protein R3E44_12420 [Paracoccaceae bacterium]
MTALQEYQRLECTGLWRDRPDGQRRDVLISFGDATLVVSDAKNLRALTHWSLPAVVRLNPGKRPARYAPAVDAGEELEIEDESMIAAISKVHRLIEARRPHPGRLRSVLLGTGAVLLLGLTLIWLPAALIDHTATALPLTKRQEIGHAALADLSRVTGTPCSSPEGQAALARLRDRLLGDEGELHVLSEGLTRSLTLPGGIILLSRSLIEGQETPDALAGEVLAAAETPTAEKAMSDLLRYVGLSATIRLLTSGDLPSGSLKDYGQTLLARPQGRPSDTALIARFAAAGIASTPYAYSLDPTGESTLALIEADPQKTGAAIEPILSDADWVALQSICQN